MFQHKRGRLWFVITSLLLCATLNVPASSTSLIHVSVLPTFVVDSVNDLEDNVLNGVRGCNSALVNVSGRSMLLSRC